MPEIRSHHPSCCVLRADSPPLQLVGFPIRALQQCSVAQQQPSPVEAAFPSPAACITQQCADITLMALQKKVNAPRLHLSSSAVLVVNGRDVTIESLRLDGALVVDAVPGAHLTIDGLHVHNDGWRWMGLSPNKPMTEIMAIR